MRLALLIALSANAFAMQGHVTSDGGRVAVLLEAPGGAVPPPRDARIDEVWLSFVPKLQVVPPGSTLIFTAKDADSHTVHGWYGNQTLFNRASVPHGPEQRVVLDREGVVTMTCDLHAEMRAWVLVSPASWSAVADSDGKLELAARPGKYRVRVWQPGDATPVDLGERELAEGFSLSAPPRVLPTPAATPNRRLYGKRPPVPNGNVPPWMQRLGERHSWPTGNWALILSIVGAPAGFALAWALFAFGARRRWSVATLLLFGCASAFVFGALSAVGLSPAVATGLGFGAFLGTMIAAARRLNG